MATSATQTMSLIAVTLPSTRYSAWMARFYTRAALNEHRLTDYTEDATEVVSELVTNAIVHTDTQAVGLELGHMQVPAALAIVVTDTSPEPPVKRDLSEAAESGRGLCLVEALSAYSPQYVKLARVLRDRIESGHYEHGDQLTAVALAAGYEVSKGVALQALAMLAANRYVANAGSFKAYRVTWDAAAAEQQEGR